MHHHLIFIVSIIIVKAELCEGILSKISFIQFLFFLVSEKKSRPLSATRKSEMKDKLDDNAEEIFKAMAEENQSVGMRL